MSSLLKQIKTNHIILAFVLFVTFLFRFPSLFEPFWYGDEGIFAAVGRNLNFGGVLYQTAWDNKPPMIFLTYQNIFNIFGVSMFWLRLVCAITVLCTSVAIYKIAQRIYGENRALVAAFAFGLLTSLRVIEGNLALTEIFMIFPISVGMMIAVARKFDLKSVFFAGLLIAIGSLYKQVGALEAGALGIFLFLSAKNFKEFFKKGLLLSAGFALPYLIAISYFGFKGILGEYIFAAYTYYRIYLGESPQYALLINILKYLPILAAVLYGLRKKMAGKVDVFHLILLWCAFSFLGSYFSGRAYGHYMIQAAPAVALLVAGITLKFKFKLEQLVFGVIFFGSLFFLTKLLFSDFYTQVPQSQIKYWQNFVDFSTGRKNVSEYNNFFDGNVNTIMALSDFFTTSGIKGTSAYICGDYPWLYAISALKNPSRYVTSFHVFGVPEGKEEVIASLEANPPKIIIKPENSIGYFEELENFIFGQYTLVSQVENSQVFVKED